jgi:predicted nucleic acid-binding protein
MDYISSDTNVWIDFKQISRVQLPFLLPYTYIMHNDAIEDELLSPKGFGEELRAAGLVGVEITSEEFFLAESYGLRFPKLSIYDRIALAIAKQRKIILLTGDMALRKAAAEEGVELMGTIGILDQLLEQKCIDKDEYRYCIEELQKLNGGIVRLPAKELLKRLQALQGQN